MRGGAYVVWPCPDGRAGRRADFRFRNNINYAENVNSVKSPRIELYRVTVYVYVLPIYRSTSADRFRAPYTELFPNDVAPYLTIQPKRRLARNTA